MKKQNSVRRWAKRTFCLLALTATAVLTLPSCDKEPKEEPYREPYEKELFFKEGNYDSIQPAVLKKFADDKACTHIYMHVMDDNNFTVYEPRVVRNFLQERINVSSKISGRGDFWFNDGIDKADSLWFVNNGWTVNKRYWER